MYRDGSLTTGASNACAYEDQPSQPKTVLVAYDSIVAKQNSVYKKEKIVARLALISHLHSSYAGHRICPLAKAMAINFPNIKNISKTVLKVLRKAGLK